MQLPPAARQRHHAQDLKLHMWPVTPAAAMGHRNMLEPPYNTPSGSTHKFRSAHGSLPNCKRLQLKGLYTASCSEHGIHQGAWMGARQDAKHEKILRELLRQPENKRCPNCDSLVGAPWG
jgi:hypothetical protein